MQWHWQFTTGFMYISKPQCGLSFHVFLSEDNMKYFLLLIKIHQREKRHSCSFKWWLWSSCKYNFIYTYNLRRNILLTNQSFLRVKSESWFHEEVMFFSGNRVKVVCCWFPECFVDFQAFGISWWYVQPGPSFLSFSRITKVS